MKSGLGTIRGAPQSGAKSRRPPKVRGIFERPKDSGVWWVSYYDAAGRRRREKAGTRGMAMALLDRRRDQRRRGIKLPETIRRKVVRFADLATVALEYSRTHKASYAQDATRYPLLVRALGERPAAEIKPRELEAALAQLAAQHDWAPATFNRVKSLASLAYRLGVQDGLVDSNPARLVRQRRVDNARLRYLGPEEELRLRAVIHSDCPQHMPELDIALHTGMRASEQYGLTWERVDLERKQITLLQTKNGRPRYIPLNAPAMAALLALRRRPAGSSVFINAVTPGRYHGKPRQNARNWFEHCIARAGIPDFTWHSLRHTFASRLVMRGVDLRSVAELMGHRTLAMVMRYSHLAPEHLAESVAKLAEAPAPGRSGVRRGVQSGTRSGTGRFAGSGFKSQVV